MQLPLSHLSPLLLAVSSAAGEPARSVLRNVLPGSEHTKPVKCRAVRRKRTSWKRSKIPLRSTFNSEEGKTLDHHYRQAFKTYSIHKTTELIEYSVLERFELGKT